MLHYANTNGGVIETVRSLHNRTAHVGECGGSS